jgi:hypothetical protein
MADDETDDTEKKPKKKALSVESVERMIEAAFIKFEMRHGHLSAEDGAAKLAALDQD